MCNLITDKSAPCKAINDKKHFEHSGHLWVDFTPKTSLLCAVVDFVSSVRSTPRSPLCRRFSFLLFVPNSFLFAEPSLIRLLLLICASACVSRQTRSSNVSPQMTQTWLSADGRRSSLLGRSPAASEEFGLSLASWTHGDSGVGNLVTAFSGENRLLPTGSLQWPPSSAATRKMLAKISWNNCLKQ